MKSNLKIITNDVFGIADRLKEIDERYTLVYNADLNRYEVHSSENRGNTLSVICPYDRVDARLLMLVRKTRRENASNLIREMEEANARLEKSEEKKKIEDTKDRAKELLEKLKSKGGAN